MREYFDGMACNASEADPLRQFNLKEWEIVKEEETR